MNIFQNKESVFLFEKLLTFLLRFDIALQKEVSKGKFTLRNNLDKPRIHRPEQ